MSLLPYVLTTLPLVLEHSGVSLVRVTALLSTPLAVTMWLIDQEKHRAAWLPLLQRPGPGVWHQDRSKGELLEPWKEEGALFMNLRELLDTERPFQVGTLLFVIRNSQGSATIP